jgi:hypothetical protein
MTTHLQADWRDLGALVGWFRRAAAAAAAACPAPGRPSLRRPPLAALAWLCSMRCGCTLWRSAAAELSVIRHHRLKAPSAAGVVFGAGTASPQTRWRSSPSPPASPRRRGPACTGEWAVGVYMCVWGGIMGWKDGVGERGGAPQGAACGGALSGSWRPAAAHQLKGSALLEFFYFLLCTATFGMCQQGPSLPPVKKLGIHSGACEYPDCVQVCTSPTPPISHHLPPACLLCSTATAVGLGGLGTASRGLGEERRVVVMARERAERALVGAAAARQPPAGCCAALRQGCPWSVPRQLGKQASRLPARWHATPPWRPPQQ